MLLVNNRRRRRYSKHRLPPRFLDLIESASQCDRDQFFNSLLDGSILIQMVLTDVTPAPYNQPPYPASGGTITDQCLVSAGRPESVGSNDDFCPYRRFPAPAA